ncbi:hypothetical protein AURDEDRAFT_167620 [Auricularia subglabra TFB-10046 SS5]|nr:hypothetical protein AURDEDRAFT_167620 [Auricularia subglabra TFB-10046 SS5]
MAEPNQNAALTVGMLELGMGVSMYLTGAATLQTWNYFRNFTDDRIFTKILVVLTYAADTLHTILLLHACYTYSIMDFGDYDQLEVILWSVDVAALLSGLVAFTVQGYYCVRLHRLTSWRLVPVIYAVLASATFAFCIAKVAVLLAGGRWQVVQESAFQWRMTSMLVVGAVTDVLITTALCTALLRMRSGLVLSDRLIYRLVSFAFGSGALTCVASIVECIVYLTWNNLAFLIPFGIVAKLYNTSLLASLNERIYIRRADRRGTVIKLKSRPRLGSSTLGDSPSSTGKIE